MTSSNLPSPLDTRSAVATYFARIRIVILIALILSGAGLASYSTMTKELNPNIQIPLVFVTTSLPGADPEDMETLVTIPIEDGVENLPDVTKTTSNSQEGLSTVTLEFASGTDPDQAKNDVQTAIDSLSTLPENAEKPIVQVLDFQNQPSAILAISEKNGERASLNHFVETLEKTLKDLPGVERINIAYQNDPVVRVSLSPETLTTHTLSLSTLSHTLSSAIGNHPAGSLRGLSTNYALGVDELANSTEKLRSLPLPVADTFVPLGALARVEERAPLNSPEAFYADQTTTPQPTILLSVFKSDTADTRETVDAVRNTATALSQKYDARFLVAPVFDGGKEISKSFDQLLHDFQLTLVLVFLVLLTFFGFRQSLVAALAIPLTFLGTFLVMQLSDISINFISLFSLLLALGILVDNAIVIVSAVTSRRRVLPEEAPMQTALRVFADYHTVILTTTITTVWAFLPLLLASGIIGEFIKPIPIVVSTALMLSALIALFIVLPLMAALLMGHFPPRLIRFGKTLTFGLLLLGLSWLLQDSRLFLPGLILSILCVIIILMTLSPLHTRLKLHPTWNHLSERFLFFRTHCNLDVLAKRYYTFIHSILMSASLRRRTFIMLILFSFFSYLLVPTGYVVNEFFPEDDQSIIYVQWKLPVGTPLQTSRDRAIELAETLRHETLANFVIAEIGAKPPTDNTPTHPDTNELLFTLILPNKEERDETSGAIVTRLNQELTSITLGEISATQVSGGPPAGSDITLKLLGPDLATLDTLATQVVTHLKQEPGIHSVATSLSAAGKLAFVPDTEALAQYGISSDTLALTLRTLGHGLTIKNDAQLKNQKRDVELTLTNAAFGGQVDDTGRILIAGSRGTTPLGSLGTFVLEQNPTSITREDGHRVLSVTAGVTTGFSVSTASKNLEQYTRESLSLPEGYTFQTGGVNEENEKSVQSILLAMLLSASLIFATMVIQFNSFRKAIIVLLVIPLAISGVFVIFALAGIPLSFPALIGVLALFGIVVNNSIIMVDKINKNMDHLDDLDEAIAEGAASRLEPILLTALTTIVGLIPITLSDPIWQGLGGAIIAGLTFSGIAKLFFIPVIYKSWFDQKKTDGPKTIGSAPQEAIAQN